MLTFRRLLSSDVIIANRRLMSSDVIIANRGSVAHFTLNRPKALNALTLPMVRNLNEAYAAAVANPEIHCILMDGAGGKAFCAGGDVKSVWDAARPGAAKTGLNSEPYLPDAFFREEYALNAAIAGCPKPQVSIWDGFAVGGGAGVSVHGACRVATSAAFAMPETNIGIFPDVGGSYFLSKLPGELGTYIGLTGTRPPWTCSTADLPRTTSRRPHCRSSSTPYLAARAQQMSPTTSRASARRSTSTRVDRHSQETVTRSTPCSPVGCLGRDTLTLPQSPALDLKSHPARPEPSLCDLKCD